MKTTNKNIKGEIFINIQTDNNNYYTRLEKAKMSGRYFFNSLDPSLKQLPIDVNKIVDTNPNWSLLFADLYDEDGYTLFKHNKDTKKFKICIDPHGMVERKRFTLAHEIGHIILGHFEYCGNQPLDPYEEAMLDREADMVAGEILMPYEHMLEHYRWSLEGLRYRFHVSDAAAKVRLSILKNDLMFTRDTAPRKKHSNILDDMVGVVNLY